MPAIDAIQPHLIEAELSRLITEAPLPGLQDEPHCPQTKAAIEDWRRVSNETGTLVESGLWLLAGELERSHVISQTYDSAEGSFWHGIMHRREGDFGNSKYWFRRVGATHPVHKELRELIRGRSSELSNLPTDQLLDAPNLSSALVDLCQSSLTTELDWQQDLEKICWWEWQLLFANVLHVGQTA